VSSRFWREGIEGLLRAVEEALSRHCLAEIGVPYDNVLAVLPRKKPHNVKDETPVDRVEPADYARAWGTWAGREHELYETSARIVEALSWTDIVSISGPTVRLLAGATRELHRRLSERALPAKLRVGDFQVIATRSGSVRVASYSEFDPLDLPTELFAVLHRFDGRSTSAALAAIEKKDGATLDDDFVRTLVDHGVLVDAS
jgi:hypothetical protein